MNRLDIVCCLLAGLCGATTYPLVMGVSDAWTFVRSMAAGTLTSACFSHLAVMMLDGSGYFPSIKWNTLWPCVAVAYLIGLMGNLICRSLIGGYEQREGLFGKLLDYIFGERPKRDPTIRAHRPDSDLPVG